tara:strand:- start:3641 stop:4726 length:1086 start_codon:yes stop_codon:yes gene_type:complete
MVYNIYITGKGNVSLSDSQLNTTLTSLALPGRNTNNWGLSWNQNLVNLLQNFASINSPANPQQGQLWYETSTQELKIYTGSVWSAITPSADSNAGSYSVAVTVGLTEYYITVILSNAQIVAAFSERLFVPAELPSIITLGSISYDLATRFPFGLAQGLTMAQVAGNLFAITGRASSAAVLENARAISLSGDASGTATFDGSQNINIAVVFGNINVAGTYSKVTVDNGGRVVAGNILLSNVDVISSLGYTPLQQVNLDGAALGTSTLYGSIANITVALADSGVAAGTYNSVTVNSKGLVTQGVVSLDTPLYSIILWPQTFPIPSNFAVCNGQTVTGSGGVSITTPDLRTFTQGATTYIQRIT